MCYIKCPDTLEKTLPPSRMICICLFAANLRYEKWSLDFIFFVFCAGGKTRQPFLPPACRTILKGSCIVCVFCAPLRFADACLCFCACTNGNSNLRQQRVLSSSPYPCTFVIRMFHTSLRYGKWSLDFIFFVFCAGGKTRQPFLPPACRTILKGSCIVCVFCAPRSAMLKSLF